MADWKNWWKRSEKSKNSECGCDNAKAEKTVSGDCKCGCSHEARESVRLTDAEIAHDIVSELTDICNDYSCLCREGCDCAQKLESCRMSRDKLIEYLGK